MCLHQQRGAVWCQSGAEPPHLTDSLDMSHTNGLIQLVFFNVQAFPVHRCKWQLYLKPTKVVRVHKHYLNESILHPQLPQKRGSSRQRGGRVRPSRLLRGGGFFHVFSRPRRWKQLPRGGYGQRRWRQRAIGSTPSSCTARWDCVYFCLKHVTAKDDFPEHCCTKTQMTHHLLANTYCGGFLCWFRIYGIENRA